MKENGIKIAFDELDFRLPLTEWVDPKVVDQAFETLLNEKSTGSGDKGGRPPVRLQRVRDLFQGRENEGVSLDKLAECFHDTNNPRQSAIVAINWLNEAFDTLDLEVEVESIMVKRNRKTSTIYRFRYRFP